MTRRNLRETLLEFISIAVLTSLALIMCTGVIAMCAIYGPVLGVIRGIEASKWIWRVLVSPAREFRSEVRR